MKNMDIDVDKMLVNQMYTCKGKVSVCHFPREAGLTGSLKTAEVRQAIKDASDNKTPSIKVHEAVDRVELVKDGNVVVSRLMDAKGRYITSNSMEAKSPAEEKNAMVTLLKVWRDILESNQKLPAGQSQNPFQTELRHFWKNDSLTGKIFRLFKDN